MEDLKEISQFRESAIRHYKYTQEGNWKNGNKEIKKINSLYKKIKKKGETAQKELLKLIYSDVPEVACLAATYSMSYNPEESLKILEILSNKNIPHISSASKYAIENWNNNEWGIK